MSLSTFLLACSLNLNNDIWLSLVKIMWSGDASNLHKLCFHPLYVWTQYKTASSCGQVDLITQTCTCCMNMCFSLCGYPDEDHIEIPGVNGVVYSVMHSYLSPSLSFSALKRHKTHSHNTYVKWVESCSQATEPDFVDVLHCILSST